jgi:hypothetical protein
MDVSQLTLEQLVRILSAKGQEDCDVGQAIIDDELVTTDQIAEYVEQRREELDVGSKGEYMESSDGKFKFSFDEGRKP